MPTLYVRIALVGLVAVACPGCTRDDAPANVAAQEPDTTAAAVPPPPDVWRPDEERSALPSNRIYYTLTDHDWYAHGQPLLHEGRPHVPSGMPVAASAGDMTKVGEYEGVEFYTRRDSAGDGVLYVPVFAGYWLAFRPDSSGGAAKVADSAAR